MVVERPLSDTLQITSSRNGEDLTFYDEGLDTHAAAVQAIFDARTWSPYRDPGWVLPGPVSGRTVAGGIPIEPDPLIFGAKEYIFQGLTTLRKHRYDCEQRVLDERYHLKVLNLTLPENWNSHMAGKLT